MTHGREAARDALLERGEPLDDLHSALARARAGRGELAVVTGEAGAGKTSLVAEFVRQAAGRPLVLRGACDPLTVPRPLGPLIDALGDVDPDAARRIVSGMTRVEAFSNALSLIDGTHSAGRPTVFLVDDAQWADEATLDLLTYLGRRIANFPALLIITFRDDEVGAQHPLRVRLGDLAPAIRSRVHLHPLSPAGVAEMAAGTNVDAVALYRQTGGNPFFVTEVLGVGSDALPESVREAVLARAGRLSEGPRAVLDAAAVVPGRVERWLLDAIAVDADVRAGLDTCLERGLLVAGTDSGGDRGDTVAFRHELARVAVVESLNISRARELHGRALAALAHPPRGAVDPARLAFHAHEAGDAPAVVEHAPAAAVEAARMGAHHEAARHLERALRQSHLIDSRRLIALLVRLGEEQTMLGQYADAAATFDRAAVEAGRIDAVDDQADAIIRAVRPLATLGRVGAAAERVDHAARLVEGRPPSRAAALIETSRLSLHMLERRFDLADRHGRRAVSLAEQVHDDSVLATALIQSGVALAMAGGDGGLERIRAGIDLANRVGDDAVVAVGHTQIGSGYGELRRYDVAVPALEEGIAHALARELVSSQHYMTAWLARCQLEQGNWDAAASMASHLVRQPRCVGVSRFVALLALGWVRTRRGDPDVTVLLDEALDLARSIGHLQRLWPVAACRAEVAWLGGRLDDELDLVGSAAALAAELDYRPAIEELAFWQRLGGVVAPTDLAAARTPFGLGAAGRHDVAAAEWARLGCPYEEAMARYLSGEEAELRAALGIFDRLGAVPMRTRTASALREAGATVPRGPNVATRENPHALTSRELEVLGLVATGRTNRQIAAALHISAKTVDHHVSHVLAKLDVRTRAEAAVAAERLGLTAPA